MRYICEYCYYNTDRNDNYQVHLKSKKHQKNIGNFKLIFDTDKESNICDKCFHNYSSRYSLYRHKKICKIQNSNNINKIIKNITEDFKEKLESIETKNVIINNNIQNIQNNTNNNSNNTTNNIVIIPYVDTDIQHITDEEFRKVISKKLHCVKELVSKKHFNPSNPENMNLAVTNIHDNYMQVFRDGWGLTKKDDMLETIFVENEQTIEDKVDELNDPVLKDIFKKYKIQISDEVEYKNIKKDLMLFMYNSTLKHNIGKK
jgi:hypothetical protein